MQPQRPTTRSSTGTPPPCHHGEEEALKWLPPEREITAPCRSLFTPVSSSDIPLRDTHTHTMYAVVGISLRVFQARRVGRFESLQVDSKNRLANVDWSHSLVKVRPLLSLWPFSFPQKRHPSPPSLFPCPPHTQTYTHTHAHTHSQPWQR